MEPSENFVELTLTYTSNSTRFTRITRTYLIATVPGSLFEAGVLIFQREVALVDSSYTLGTRLKMMLRILDATPDCRRIVDLPAAEISDYEIKQAVMAFEEACHRKGLSSSYSDNASRLFRQIICKADAVLKGGRTTTAVVQGIRSERKRMRRLSTIRSDSAPPPFPHKNIPELIEKSIDHFREEHDSYLHAAKNAIDDYLSTRKHLQSLVDLSLDEEVLNQFNDRLKLSDPWRDHPFNDNELDAFILKEVLKAKTSVDIHLPGAKALKSLEQRSDLRTATSYIPYWLSYVCLPMCVLVAIATVIAIKTGWNTNSVSNLRFTDIRKLNSSRFLLQGEKRKTDDRTPIVEVHKNDLLFFQSIELLYWHFKNVVSFDWYNGDRIFISKSRSPRDLSHSHVNPFAKSYFEKHLVRRFKLKKVTPKSFRDGVASRKWLETNDIHVIRELLGHNSINTTREYLKSGIIHSLNESKVLEFQRRIEATIIYIDKGHGHLKKLNMNEQHVDLNLIPSVQLGDGTQCLDPSAPPLLQEKSGICSGMFCHEGNGCPNNRIVIGVSDVELLLRTLDYYKSRWQFLYSQNPDLFKKVHLSKIIFMRVLYSIVEADRPDIIQLTNTKVRNG